MATPAAKMQKARGAKKGGKHTSRTVKAGLIFPVGRFTTMLRKGRFAKRISASSGVYMAAVMEYLTAEMLEVSAKVAIASKKKRISPRSVTLAVRNDAGLGALLQNVTLSKGGVAPNLAKALEMKKKGKKHTPKV